MSDNANEQGQRKYNPFHPVTFTPTDDPDYIDGQVKDILAELAECEYIEPFVPGPIGAMRSTPTPSPLVLDAPRDQFNGMMNDLFSSRPTRVPGTLTVERIESGFLVRRT